MFWIPSMHMLKINREIHGWKVCQAVLSTSTEKQPPAQKAPKHGSARKDRICKRRLLSFLCFPKGLLLALKGQHRKPYSFWVISLSIFQIVQLSMPVLGHQQRLGFFSLIVLEGNLHDKGEFLLAQKTDSKPSTLFKPNIWTA